MGHRGGVGAGESGSSSGGRRLLAVILPTTWLLLITTSLLASAADARRPIWFERLSSAHGRPQSSALAVFQDSVGYVWVGTPDGLDRLDGSGVAVFKADSLDPRAMPGNHVRAIDEGPDGDLWIATEDGGVGRFDRTTGATSRVRLGDELAARALLVDADGTVWVGLRDKGVRRLDPDTGDVRAYRFAVDGLPDDGVYALHRGPRGNLWVGTDAGLAKYDVELDRFQAEFVPGSENGIGGLRVRSIAHDRTGALWVGTLDGGVSRVELDDRAVRVYRNDPDNRSSLSDDRVYSLLEDDDGRMWVGTAAGLNLYDEERERFVRYVRDPTDPHSLSDDQVVSLMQDRTGTIWVGTRFGGIHKWHPRSWQLGHRRSIGRGPRAELHRSPVTAFTEDARGRLWIASLAEGIVVESADGEIVARHRHAPGDPHSLGSDRVTTMRTDRRGDVWVGTEDAGLLRYDSQTGRFERFRHDPDVEGSLSAEHVSAIAEDARGRLWVGTFGGGVNVLDPGGSGFQVYRHDPYDVCTIGSDRVTALAVARDGRVWVGTHGGGVTLLDPDRTCAERYVHHPGDPSSLPSDLVRSLFLDESGDGDMWVGTTGGLSRLRIEPDGAVGFRTYRQRDGMPNDVIESIQQDGQGRIWVSTRGGIACFDPDSEAIRAYGLGDGVQALEFETGSGFTRRSGEMLFGGVNGFNAFHPGRIEHNGRGPRLVLSSVALDHSEVEGPADQIETLRLAHRNRAVSFQFSVLDFEDPARNRISYRLDGFDERWIRGEPGRPLTYTNLDPGRYTLRARASNAEGVQSDYELRIELRVEPSPWRTGWAYGGYALGTFGSLLGFVQVQRRRVAREEEHSRMLEEQVARRTRELSQRTRELEDVNRRLARASVTDALTGFANRRFLLEYIEKEVALVHRRQYMAGDPGPTVAKFDLAFVMIDLDSFKRVNDTYGHHGGDSVLQQLRDILHEVCRKSDIVIRWGGDEFLLVARDQDAVSVATLAERIRARIAAHEFEVGEGLGVRLTCSIGYACYPFLRSDARALSWEQVVSVADRALYVSKRSGRDAWVGLEGSEATDARTLLASLREDLEQLVRQDEIHLHTSIDGVTRSIEWTLED